jgi:hypothetical protein
MARRTKTTPKGSDATPKPPVPLKVVLEFHGESFYSNYVEVSSAQHEFQIRFAQAPTKPNDEQMEQIRGGTLKLDAFVQILVPPTLIPSLIRALESTKQQYENLIGPFNEYGV